MVVFCCNKSCKYSERINEKRIGRYHPIDLSEVYLFLVNDAGYIGYQHHVWADAFIARCKKSFYNHARMVFSIMNKFYDANMPAVHADIKSFYERNSLGYVDPQSGLMDITVSLDGTWSHRGFSAIIGVGFVMDVYTGGQ